MKIDYIKINGFGKLKNKFIKFEDGINIIYGENESGKSTIVKFIISILYGLSKNKNGKKFTDFEQYTPWSESEFSGKMNYTIGNEEFEVFKDFKKKNPVIYNKNGEDISKSFTVNKSKEIEYFEDQSKIDESTFVNTAVIEQESIELEGKATNSIVQKISNLVSTGDDNISYQKSMNKIEKMQTENIGSDKTKNRPINIVNDKIDQLTKEKRELENFKEKVNENFQKKENTLEQIKIIDNEKEFIKYLKHYKNEIQLKEAEVQFAIKLEDEYLQKAEEYRQKLNSIKSENDTNNLKNNRIIFYVLDFLFVVIAIILFLNIENKLFLLIPGIGFLFNMILMLYNRKKTKNTKNEKQLEIEKTYEITAKEYIEKKKNREEKEKSLQNEIEKYYNQITQKYSNTFDKTYINEKFNMNIVQLDKTLENLENEFKELSVRLKVLENEIEIVDSNLEKLAITEEELSNNKEAKNELENLNISFEIAKECLKNAYENIKQNLSPKFESKLCEITDNLTNGKYKNVILNGENGLFVEIENGQYMPIERLSIGTIDEMYLALRLSILDEITTENMPIIFDETFAYFDDKRIENALLYLLNNKYNSQIMIFTCSKREEEILKKLRIDYNLINL